MEKIYIMKNRKPGSLRGEFESNEEIVKAQKIVDSRASVYKSERIMAYKKLNIFREEWDKNYKK